MPKVFREVAKLPSEAILADLRRGSEDHNCDRLTRPSTNLSLPIGVLQVDLGRSQRWQLNTRRRDRHNRRVLAESMSHNLFERTNRQRTHQPWK